MLLAYRSVGERRAGLELKLATLTRANNPVASPGDAALDSRLAVSSAQAAQDLSTPWTLLLAELEQASKDNQGQVSLLGVEPDHGKHSVRVSAEARTLALAIAYVQRLQASRSLQYPMLDRHEIRADDPQHPVRFELTGSWRDL
ncbi:MAG: hypothetical protein ACYC9Z_14070 [Casimicrobiaceae bacterium]